MPARALAIGDIHGCDVALEVLLSKVSPTIDDTVVLIGDVVSRGPGTKRCIDLLIDLGKTCRFIFIRGNHEEMMLNAFDHGPLEPVWLAHGGQQALDSYGGRYQDVPNEHLNFLQSSVDVFQTETEIYVHANLQPGVALEEQTSQWLRWMRFTGNEEPHASGKQVVCGHTPQASGLPSVIDGWMCLDTWAYNDLYLTCLDVTNQIIHQAKQSGEYRSMPLNDMTGDD